MAHVLGMHFQRCANMLLQTKNVYWFELCIYKGCLKCHLEMFYMGQIIGQGHVNME